MRPLSRLFAAVLLISSVASAQVKETVTVSVVEVPVTVVDRSGNPVRGLTARNFELVDQGKKRDISSLDVIDFASPEVMKDVSPLNPTARRNFLLLYDLSFSSPRSLQRAHDAAAQFLDKLTDKRDKVAVATIDAEKGFRLVTAFTTDRKLVTAALSNPSNYRAMDPLQIASRPEELQTAAIQSTGAGDRDAAAREELNERLRAGNREAAQGERQKIARQVNYLAGLARTLRSVNGQKHVVLLSEGFNASLVQGREAGASNDQIRENQAIESGRIWEVDTDARFGSVSSMTVIDKMAEMFKRSDVVLHAIDIKGIRVDDTVSNNAGHTSNEGLFLLANSTGGQLIKNANDLGGDFQRLLRQQEVVYVLAFNAPTSEPGKFHNLKVKLVDVPGARVNYRAGYYEAGGENAVERSLSTAEVIVNDIPQDAVRIASLAMPFPTSSANAQVPVVVEISGADLLKRNTPVVGAELFVYAFDADGTVRDSLFQRISFEVPKVGDTLRATGVKYYGTLSLPPGKYAVKTLVNVPDSGAKGFQRTDVVVPAANTVTISQPVFLDEGPKWVMVKGTSHDKTNAAYPFEVSGSTFVPSAAVRSSDGPRRKFAVFAWNASPDEVSWETAPKASVLAQSKSGSMARALFEIEGISPSAQLQVTMSKKGSDQKVSSTAVIR